MASYNANILRRKPSPVSDPDLVGKDEHVNELHDRDIRTLCRKICMDEDYCDRTLSNLSHSLGIDAKELSTGKSADKIYQLIQIWSKKEGSTVGILMDAMSDIERQDCLQFIEDARKKPTKLHLRLHYGAGNSESVNLSDCVTSVPARKGLKSVVEPLVHSHIQSQFPHNDQGEFRVYLKKFANEDLLWDTPVTKFAGQQIHLYLIEVKSTISDRSISWNPEMMDIKRSATYVPRRNANTEYRASLSFEYSEADKEKFFNEFCKTFPTKSDKKTELLNKPTEESGLVSLHEDENVLTDCRSDQNKIFQSASHGTNYSEAQPEYDFQSSNDCGGNVPEEDKSVQSAKASCKPIPPKPLPRPSPKSSHIVSLRLPETEDEEWKAVSKLPGFRSFEPNVKVFREQAKKDIDAYYKEHEKNGCYIIRPSQSETKGHRFALTLKYDAMVYHFTIARDLYSGTYSLLDFNKKAFDTVQSLIEYFTTNCICGEVKLSVPVQ